MKERFGNVWRWFSRNDFVPRVLDEVGLRRFATS
jgi:hypothetical protein